MVSKMIFLITSGLSIVIYTTVWMKMKINDEIEELIDEESLKDINKVTLKKSIKLPLV